MTTTEREYEASVDDAASQAGDADNEGSDGLAAAQLIWKDSPEYKRFVRERRTNRIIGAVLFVASPIWMGAMYSFDQSLQFNVGSVVAGTVLLWFAVYISVFFMSYIVERTTRRQFDERVRLVVAEQIGKDEKELAKKAKDGQLDLASLWALNQERIEYYHNIARSQAENSYKSAQVAGIVGFIAVLGLGALAAFATSGTASIAVAAVGVAGAAMSAYIGATFMKIQAEASSQFRQFFREPVDVSRLLGAERLINTLGDEAEKARAVQIVVSDSKGK